MLKGLCHDCLVHIFFVNITNCAFLGALVTKKLLVNDKITASFPTNMSPKHYINHYKQESELGETVIG